MAVDMFLKLDGIKGESIDSKHKDEIDVLSWSFGASQSISIGAGGGGGAGKVRFQDITFTKFVDKATPEVLSHVANGKHIKDALLTVRKAGGKSPVEYLKIKLTDVLVSSYTTGGSGGEDRITENVSIAFAKIELAYTPQKVDGSADVAILASWNVAQNIA